MHPAMSRGSERSHMVKTAERIRQRPPLRPDAQIRTLTLSPGASTSSVCTSPITQAVTFTGVTGVTCTPSSSGYPSQAERPLPVNSPKRPPERVLCFTQFAPRQGSPHNRVHICTRIELGNCHARAPRLPNLRQNTHTRHTVHRLHGYL